MAEYCRQLSKIKEFHIFGPTYAKDNCPHFVLQNGILYANFCLVQYLCDMGDNTKINTSLNKVGNIALLCLNINMQHIYLFI